LVKEGESEPSVHSNYFFFAGFFSSFLGLLSFAKFITSQLVMHASYILALLRLLEPPAAPMQWLFGKQSTVELDACFDMIFRQYAL
jgi:hypothetical protein